MITLRALAAQAITLSEAQELEDWIDGDDWDNEEDMPSHIRRIYDISLQHYHRGMTH